MASSASRRTASPALSTTSTEISLRSRSSTSKRLTSFVPSPLGEKTRARLTTCATAGSPLIRWAAKNAANVAPTSSTKTTRASGVTYGDLSAPRTTVTSAGSVPVSSELSASACVSSSISSMREMSSRRDDVARLAALLGVVVDDGVLALLVVAVVDPDHALLVGVAGGEQLVAEVRGEAVDRRAVEHDDDLLGPRLGRAPAGAARRLVGVPPGSATGFGGGAESSPERTMK